jgi:putative spermidine/putrescine transport system ATP-binding protein
VFSNGRIEQVGSPLDVYHRPVNRFVGEFIGDSNFFAGRADPARPDLVELTGIGPVRVAAKGDVAGGAVDLMIRPERLRLLAGAETAGTDNSFEMILDDIINYGDSILAIGKTQGLPLRARLVQGAPDVLQPGAVLKLAWAPADAHVIARGRTETSMGRSL